MATGRLKLLPKSEEIVFVSGLKIIRQVQYSPVKVSQGAAFSKIRYPADPRPFPVHQTQPQRAGVPGAKPQRRQEPPKRFTLLSDTEFAEDIVQLVFVGDFSSNLAKVMQASADVQCQQVTGNSVIHSRLYVIQ